MDGLDRGLDLESPWTAERMGGVEPRLALTDQGNAPAGRVLLVEGDEPAVVLAGLGAGHRQADQGGKAVRLRLRPEEFGERSGEVESLGRQ